MKKQLLILAAALLPQAAFAQIDVTLQAGYRVGGLEAEADIVCLAGIGAPCQRFAKTDDDSLLGLTVGFPVGAGEWAVEAHLSHQQTDLLYADPVALILPNDWEAKVTVLEGSFVRRFSLGNWEPFAGAGLGVARIDMDPTPITDLDGEDCLTANLVGGVRYSLGNSWGLRFEGRARWLSLPDDLDGDEVTGESSVGISFRL